MDELLTDAEHLLIKQLGECATVYFDVVGTGRTATADINEFVHKIHDLQHAVMAQAAARAYPDLYRLAGGTVGER